MGLAIYYTHVEHRLFVVKGVRALDSGDEGELRAVVQELLDQPLVPYEEEIRERRERLVKLAGFDAPPLVLDHEQESLERLLGNDRKQELVDSADAQALRDLLYRWGQYEPAASCIEKQFDPILYCVAEGTLEDMCKEPTERSSIEQALFGSQRVPTLSTGEPLWEDVDGYTPPAAVERLVQYLESIDTSTWSKLGTKEELDTVLYYFEILRSAYRSAADRNLGVVGKVV